MKYKDLMVSHVVILNSISTNFVFKGALLLNIMGDDSVLPFRATSDIDFDYTDINVSQSDLDGIIRLSCQILKSKGYHLKAVCFRQFGVGRSAGYNIISETGVKLYHLDISIREQRNSCINYINDSPVRCATLEKIICDKLSAVSNRQVNRRVKDVFDLYYLISLYNLSYREIVKTFNTSDRVLGDFNVFLTSYDNLSHAYAVYKGIICKEDFALIYARVSMFCLPFKRYGLSSKGECIWISSECEWVC